MDKKAKIGLIASAAALVAGVGVMAAQPEADATYEAKLLKGAAAYVEQYDGKEPAGALQYVLHTIDVVEEGDAKLNGLSQLEKNVSEIRDEVIYLGNYRNPPTLYHAALEDTANQVRNVVNENAPSKAPTFIGAGFLLASALSAMYGFHSLKRKKTTP